MKFDTIVEETRHTFDSVAQHHAKKFPLTNSEAIYGKQPFGMIHVSKDYYRAFDPTDPNPDSEEGKRVAEFLCVLYSRKHGIETKIARCFAFVGPYLPLDIHYAIENFIWDGLNGGPIEVNGDGTPYRSYLYAADLAIWLWVLLFRGKPGEAYNVGSENAITIKDLAYKVAASFSNPPKVVIAKSPVHGRLPERYVASIKKARERLGLDSWIRLDEALGRKQSGIR